MDKQINILYTFDSRFCKLASVSIYSALSSQSPDTICNVYCMVAPHTRGLKRIQRIIDTFPNARLIWRPISKSENPFQSFEFLRWSPVIFYRLLACKIFPDVDKMLYMDSDTIIRGNLNELFDTNISNHAIAAAIDIAPVNDKSSPSGLEIKEFSQKYLNGGPYFNSGVLLINMKKTAEMFSKILSTKIPMKFPDQDLLNASLCDLILPIHLKYNKVPGLPFMPHIPEHLNLAPEEEAVIWHFYVAKPYIYKYVPRNAYSAFFRAAQAVNLSPEDFIRDEEKYSRIISRKQDRKIYRKLFPFLRITNRHIKLFGITLAKNNQ